MKKQLLLALVVAMFTQSAFGYHWRVRNSTSNTVLKVTWKADFKKAVTKVIQPGKSAEYKLSGGDAGLCLKEIHVAGIGGLGSGYSTDAYADNRSRCKSGVMEVYIPKEAALLPAWQRQQASVSGAGAGSQTTVVQVGGTSSSTADSELLIKELKLKHRWVN